MNKKKFLLTSLAVSLAVAAPSVFAVTAAETAVGTAITSSESLVNLIAPGVIGIAAIMLGVGIAVSWLRK